MIVRLTKTGGPTGVCLFGSFAKGAHLDIKIPARVAEQGEQEAKIRARRMMQRDFPDENAMEWESDVVREET